MKKIILIACVGAMMCQPCFSKGVTEKYETHQQNSVDALFKNFAKEKNVTHVKVGGFIMALARAFTDTKGVAGVEVFAFDECDQTVKDKLNDAIKNLKDNAYETLVSTTQNGERTKILVRIKGDFINEIIVIAGGNDPAIVRIKGKIKPEDMQNVVNNNKK